MDPLYITPFYYMAGPSKFRSALAAKTNPDYEKYVASPPYTVCIVGLYAVDENLLKSIVSESVAACYRTNPDIRHPEGFLYADNTGQ
jgi:hypothetical protein